MRFRIPPGKCGRGIGDRARFLKEPLQPGLSRAGKGKALFAGADRASLLSVCIASVWVGKENEEHRRYEGHRAGLREFALSASISGSLVGHGFPISDNPPALDKSSVGEPRTGEGCDHRVQKRNMRRINYCDFRACIGSTLAALFAGRKQAASAARRRRRLTAASTG
jgi:hypothetical protein